MSVGHEPAGGLPRNYLRACIVLLLNEQPSHGYDLIDGLGALGLHSADPGGLYRALRAMEQEDLVTSWWEESLSGPARRSYSLTDEGRDWLHAWAGTLGEVRRNLGVYLDRYAATTYQMDRS